MRRVRRINTTHTPNTLVAVKPQRATFQPLEPRRLLSATAAQIGEALDLDASVEVTYLGHDDAVGVYEDYTVNGILGIPSGPDGDFLVLSTGHARDAIRLTDTESKTDSTRYRDLGDAGVADDFAEITFTIEIDPAVYNQRLLIDFVYASDMDTDGGDFFDIIIDGVNIAEIDGSRIEAGGQYVTNERNPDIEDDVAGYAIEIDTEYTDLLTASYTIPDGASSIEVTIRIVDSEDPEKDAWALIDNVRLEDTQVIFLDFDGEDAGDFFFPGTNYVIPEFDWNDFGLGADYADVIQADLESIFGDFDIVFTTSLPAEGSYMHVIVGGDNSDELSIADTEENEWLIREVGDTPSVEEVYNYTHFRNSNGHEASYGLADRLDLGNEIKDDTALVFAEQISRDGYSYSHLRDTLAHYIGRNLGLRAESNAFTSSIMAEDIALRGGEFENAAHSFLLDKWGDLDSLTSTQNAHEVLLDNLGATDGDQNLRNSWHDARRLNTANWTIAQPVRKELFDAHFIILGDPHTRPVETIVDVWDTNQVLVTDYAGQDPQIIITAASKAGKFHDYETIGTRNLGQFSAVEDNASFTLVGMWEFAGQGYFFQGSTSLFQTASNASEVYYSDYKYTEDDGDEVTIKLKSNTGLFAVQESNDGIVITLAETDANRDSLTFTVKKKPDGDGVAIISGIQGTGVKTLTASKTVLDGTGVNLVALKTGKFGDVINGTDISIRQDEKTKANYTFEIVDGDSHLAFGRETNKLKADELNAGVLVIDTINKIDSKGDMHIEHLSIRDGRKTNIKVREDLNGGQWEFWGLLNDNDNELQDSLKMLDVRGNTNGLTIDATRRIVKIKARENFDADISAAAVTNVDIKGDWSGSLILSDDGTMYGNSAKNIKVKQAANGVLFQAANDVKDIKLGAAIDSNFYIGFDFEVVDGLPVDLELMTNPDARVKKLTITGTKELPFDMVNSTFSTGRFDKVKLGFIDGINFGIPFGITAIQIDKIEFDTGTGKVKNKKEDSFIDNDSSDDFFIGRII